MSAPALPAPPAMLPGSPLLPPEAAGDDRLPELAGCSLAQLFERVQHGDEAAFAELYRQTRRRLHAVVHQVLRSPDLTEDVVQETYGHIWAHRHQFRPELGSVLGWMSTIARRRAIDRVRALVRTRSLETRYADSSATSAETDHQTRVVDAVHATAVTSHALTTLTPTQREALLLTYWGGRTAAEAAQLLGIPLPTLKSRIHSATSRLRRLLDPHRPAQTDDSRSAAPGTLPLATTGSRVLPPLPLGLPLTASPLVVPAG